MPHILQAAKVRLLAFQPEAIRAATTRRLNGRSRHWSDHWWLPPVQGSPMRWQQHLGTYRTVNRHRQVSSGLLIKHSGRATYKVHLIDGKDTSVGVLALRVWCT